MAVYQSATKPIVRRRGYIETHSGHAVESIGKRKLIQWMRKSGKIPAKVKPVETLTAFGWEFRFDWFEVETNA